MPRKQAVKVRKNNTRERYPKEVRARALRMLAAGDSNVRIAAALNVTDKAVSYWKRQAVKKGELQKTNGQALPDNPPTPYGLATSNAKLIGELEARRGDIQVKIEQLQEDVAALDRAIAILKR